MIGAVSGSGERCRARPGHLLKRKVAAAAVKVRAAAMSKTSAPKSERGKFSKQNVAVVAAQVHSVRVVCWTARQIHHLARRQKRHPHRMHLRCNNSDFVLLVNLSRSRLGAEVSDIAAARTYIVTTTTFCV